MHSSSILSALCAVSAMAGPVFNQRNLPQGVGHQHNHMDFHAHKARDDGTPAEQMMAELASLPGASGLPAADGGSPAPAAPAPAPVAENKHEVVVVVTTTEGASAPTPSAPTSSAPTPSASDGSVAGVHKKISGPAVQQQGQQQQQQQPAQSSTPNPSSGGGNGIPSAPTSFQEHLTADDQAYKDLVLVHHNIHRANHSLPALEWNDTLFEFAKNSAQSCVYEHTNPVPPYGQNIAAGNAPGNVSADITNGFYNGEIDLFRQAIGQFGQDSPDMADFEHWGHATQMLWKETTSVACYTAACAPPGADPLDCGPNGSYLKNVGCGNRGTRAFNLVCDYYPPGNYPNQYSSVPGPTGSKPFVQMTNDGVVGLS